MPGHTLCAGGTVAAKSPRCTGGGVYAADGAELLIIGLQGSVHEIAETGGYEHLFVVSEWAEVFVHETSSVIHIESKRTD